MIITSFICSAKKGSLREDESVVANSGKPEEEEISYRGFSNFDEIALTHPNDQQKDLAGILEIVIHYYLYFNLI